MFLWLYLLIFTLGLTLFSIFANNRRYKYLQMAYEFYKNQEENFLDYVLMEPTELEETTINKEINLIKRREVFWIKISLLSYGLIMIICAAIMILSFYNLLNIPKFVSFIFLGLLICSSYINYRGWRHFKFSKRKKLFKKRRY